MVAEEGGSCRGGNMVGSRQGSAPMDVPHGGVLVGVPHGGTRGCHGVRNGLWADTGERRCRVAGDVVVSWRDDDGAVCTEEQGEQEEGYSAAVCGWWGCIVRMVRMQ